MVELAICTRFCRESIYLRAGDGWMEGERGGCVLWCRRALLHLAYMHLVRYAIFRVLGHNAAGRSNGVDTTSSYTTVEPPRFSVP